MITSDFAATQRTFLSRLQMLIDAWTAAETAINQATIEIERQKAAKEAYNSEITKLRNAAEVLGFDLLEVWNASFLATAVTETAPSSFLSPQPDGSGRIKDLVLLQAKSAYPNAVRAAQIRDLLRSQGHDIHDKTVGMSLYRWLRQGRMERQGMDWFYVPTPEEEGEIQGVRGT